MIKLQSYVDKVWAATDRVEKIKHLTEMVNASTAKKLTKIKTLRDMAHMNNTQLDFLATNYSMSGEGLKVLR
jgi:Na+-translocating ferredoxin:NAD+ oxidoreductase RnfC subunit